MMCLPLRPRPRPFFGRPHPIRPDVQLILAKLNFRPQLNNLVFFGPFFLPASPDRLFWGGCGLRRPTFPPPDPPPGATDSKTRNQFVEALILGGGKVFFLCDETFPADWNQKICALFVCFGRTHCPSTKVFLDPAQSTPSKHSPSPGFARPNGAVSFILNEISNDLVIHSPNTTNFLPIASRPCAVSPSQPPFLPPVTLPTQQPTVIITLFIPSASIMADSAYETVTARTSCPPPPSPPVHSPRSPGRPPPSTVPTVFSTDFSSSPNAHPQPGQSERQGMANWPVWFTPSQVVFVSAPSAFTIVFFFRPLSFPPVNKRSAPHIRSGGQTNH